VDGWFADKKELGLACFVESWLVHIKRSHIYYVQMHYIAYHAMHMLSVSIYIKNLLTCLLTILNISQVLTKDERAKFMTGNTKETKRLMDKYNRLEAQQKVIETRQKEAQAVKDRLLEYDRTSVRRTKVIDDQSDYFAAENPWLSEEEKVYIQKKQEAYRDAKNRLKRKTKVTIDFAGN